MKLSVVLIAPLTFGLVTMALVHEGQATSAPILPDEAADNAQELFRRGRQAFRHDTFGSEDFWGGTLRLHEALAGAANGGVGAGVSPATALAVGLKIDIDALPVNRLANLLAGPNALNDPGVTMSLLKADAVIGVTGVFDTQGQITSVGIQCALCHSTVDDSFAPGIGKRQDGWANRDLDIGTIISLAPDVSPFANLLNVSQATARSVFQSWGPGRFDAHLLLDGKAFRPDGESGSVLIPAANGLAGVNMATYNGWGSVAHWNALVGNLEMGGKGTFVDTRLNDAARFPIAAAAGFADVRTTDDRISPALDALHFYQLAMPSPEPPIGSFDQMAADRGEALFNGVADCASCHVPPLYTEPGWNMHTPAEIGIDDFQAKRGPEDRYRTTPLGGLFARQKGGFFHDGRFATLQDVLNHYDGFFGLGLTSAEKSDLEQFLLSL